MFSLDRFYHILHDNLLNKFKNGKSFHPYPFGSTDNFSMIFNSAMLDIKYIPSDEWHISHPGMQRRYVHCFFLDQEPLYEINLPALDQHIIEPERAKLNIIATSEKSEVKQEFLRKHRNFYDWYYFFHGFAALDWYKDFQYLNPQSFDHFDKVFISYNHLISKYRSYRLHLVSNLINQDLVKHGYVSLFLEDNLGTWRDEVTRHDSLLDNRAKTKIFKALNKVTEPLIIDTDAPSGNLSAEVFPEQLTKALWHIVTETVYFPRKIHLTEKIFKPIVAQRPFILVAAPGNLAYLKSYGFKTFDKWIDESYDSEQDDYIRIEKITAEISKLCTLSAQGLKAMHNEMREVLEYNYNHFFGDFKRILVNELVDNFEGVLMQFNNGKMPNNHSRYHERYELPKKYLEEVKQRLLK